MGQDIDRAARVRAARAIAGLKQPELGALISTSAQTVKRMESGEKAVSLDELRLIADSCGVPRWFMENGFSGRDEVSEQAAQLEASVARIEQGLARDAARHQALVASLAARLETLEALQPFGGDSRHAADLSRERAAVANELAQAQIVRDQAAASSTEPAARAARRAAEAARRQTEAPAQSPPKRSSRPK